VCPEILQAQRVGLADQQTEDAVPLGVVADPFDRLPVHADRDELPDRALLPQHAQSAVLGVHQVDGGLDDPAQQVLQFQVAADRHHRVQQRLHAVPAAAYAAGVHPVAGPRREVWGAAPRGQ
jgi:hypothetical protein